VVAVLVIHHLLHQAKEITVAVIHHQVAIILLVVEVAHLPLVATTQEIHLVPAALELLRLLQAHL
jgi:hypothetical protein